MAGAVPDRERSTGGTATGVAALGDRTLRSSTLSAAADFNHGGGFGLPSGAPDPPTNCVLEMHEDGTERASVMSWAMGATAIIADRSGGET
jgi:hypothetical protein